MIDLVEKFEKKIGEKNIRRVQIKKKEKEKILNLKTKMFKKSQF